MQLLAIRRSICPNCFKALEAELCLDEEAVYLRKQCACFPEPTLTPLSSDPSYFLSSLAKVERLRKAHSVRPGFSALIIELTDDCNLECPTCIAGSKPGAGNHKALLTVQTMIREAESTVPTPDILMISGGEPTVHPQILEILQSACASSIKHIMMITNGKRLAEERSFVEALSRLSREIEIYLQFDSLQPNVLQDIRGTDLSKIRRDAIAVLNEFRIPTTLVSVVKRGVNDTLCGQVLKFALSIPCIRGVTFQPIKASGRTSTLKEKTQLIDLATVRREIIKAGIGLGPEDLIPHPSSPENVCIGYLARAPQGFAPVTDSIFPIPSGYDVRNGAEQKYPLFLPPGKSYGMSSDSLFRVAIVAYMDKYTFCEELLPLQLIGFIMPDGQTVPIDTYYMFGRAFQPTPAGTARTDYSA